MHLRRPNLFYTVLSVALATFGYWSFLNTLEPMPTPLMEASGSVSAAEANRRKGSIHTIYFSLHGSQKRFAYPGILPRIDDVWSSLELGSNAQVLYTDKDPSTEVVELWGLTVNGRSLIQPTEAYRARRENGYWGLALGIAFTFSAGYMWFKGGKGAA
ncbi:hypothetical protein V3390_06130 [Luteimonas sp. FXH3W]|uniref:DUF3592 domain-containing protein n=1 Tax=Aquilutibacter rugosus TaxID=3115820 RepID=A0ABU7V0K9_9GAMM